MLVLLMEAVEDSNSWRTRAVLHPKQLQICLLSRIDPMLIPRLLQLQNVSAPRLEIIPYHSPLRGS